jgi:hypothetical protein
MTSVDHHRSGNLIFRGGLRPELVAVPSGSYHNGYFWGPGATALMSYNNVTYPHGVNLNVAGTAQGPFFTTTYCEYRRTDDFVVFNMDMTFNAQATAPTSTLLGTGAELRIRVLSPITNNIGGLTSFQSPPNSYSRGLPIPSSNYMSPKIGDVMLYTTAASALGGGWNPAAWGGILPTVISTVASGRTCGRLLNDDTIALFYEEFRTGTAGVANAGPDEIPLVVSTFGAFFSPNLATGSALKLVIKGTYICA